MQQRVLKYKADLFKVQIGPYNDPESKTPMLQVHFGWSAAASWNGFKDTIKLEMVGTRFRDEGGKKFWTIADCPRNRFLLDFMDKNMPNPYDKWRSPFPFIENQPRINPWSEYNTGVIKHYQQECVSEIVAKRQFELAAEMGTGKTLIAITVLDLIHPTDCWYIAPAMAIHGLKRQFMPPSADNPQGWNCSVWPKFMSYDGMVKELKNWKAGRRAPDAVIFDESVQLKSPGIVRTQYAQALTDGMRSDWDNPLILNMSGAPAPKSPTDFWQQFEIMIPGFLKERSHYDFEHRLALVKKIDSGGGGGYPKLITWWDDPAKCAECGQYEDHEEHDTLGVHFHPYKPKGINEVAHLYERMGGAIRVLFKKDVLPELPEKVYREVVAEPDAATLRRLKLILKGSKTTIEGLTLARELSDGIRYETVDSETEFEPCERCNGTGTMRDYDGEANALDLACDRCDHGDGSTGLQRKQVGNTLYVATPKDKALRELLEENEDQGRIVIFAGFTGSINRIVKLCQQEGWNTVRADGSTSSAKHRCIANWDNGERHPLDEFQDQNSQVAKMAFIAHPQTAKTSLTLTRACMIVYYSNSFNADDRIQSEDRIHRIGMDLNKGATIVDIFHLYTDKYVLDNLRNKRRLQSISLGEIIRAGNLD